MAQLAAGPSPGREHPLQAAGLDDLRRRWGGGLLVKATGLFLREVPVGQRDDAEGPAAGREGDRERVPDVNLPVGAGGRAVQVDLSPLAGRRRLRSGREETGNVEEDVESDFVQKVGFSTDLSKTYLYLYPKTSTVCSYFAEILIMAPFLVIRISSRGSGTAASWARR